MSEKAITYFTDTVCNDFPVDFCKKKQKTQTVTLVSKETINNLFQFPMGDYCDYAALGNIEPSIQQTYNVDLAASQNLYNVGPMSLFYDNETAQLIVGKTEIYRAVEI
jgi:hypothetical protein